MGFDPVFLRSLGFILGAKRHTPSETECACIALYFGFYAAKTDRLSLSVCLILFGKSNAVKLLWEFIFKPYYKLCPG